MIKSLTFRGGSGLDQEEVAASAERSGRERETQTPKTAAVEIKSDQEKQNITLESAHKIDEPNNTTQYYMLFETL